MTKLTAEEHERFINSTHCHICNKEFKVDDVKVRDHDHQTGKFRNAAHQNCNLNYKEDFVIPVVFHNLTGYDGHFLIRSLSREIPEQISLLPINKEKYISFTKYLENTQ